MFLGEIIKNYRKTHNLSMEKFADLAGLSKGYISMLEKNRNPQNARKLAPSVDTFKKVASVMNVEAEELIKMTDDRQPVLMVKEDSLIYSPKHNLKIPVLGMVHAGYPVDAIENVLDWEEVTPEMASRGDLMALQVRGDCMEPRFSEGDVVIVLCQNTADSGDIVIVMVNHDEAEMKKIKKFENGSINLIPLNPAYPARSYTPEEIVSLPIRILGKVIELRAKF